MSSAFRLLPNYTYEEYCQWEGKWELIDGIPYAMSPQPRPEHQMLAGNLHAEFRAAIKKAGCRCKVYQPIDYKVSDDTVLNPDISIICQPVKTPFIDFPPELVVEILSPLTAMIDRHTKYHIYETQGILYYILVDIEQQNIEVFHHTNSAYQKQEVNQKELFHIQFSGCGFDIVFDNIWD